MTEEKKKEEKVEKIEGEVLNKKEEKETKEFGRNAGDQSAPTEQGWDSKEEPVAETDTSWESQKGDLLDKSVRENQYFNLHEFKNYKEFNYN